MGPAAVNEDNLTPSWAGIRHNCWNGCYAPVQDRKGQAIGSPCVSRIWYLAKRISCAAWVARSRSHLRRPARVFIQRLREGEHRLQSVRRVPISAACERSTLMVVHSKLADPQRSPP
ncbi:hypothetical protein GQ600_7687 [Phytophthora cactorum]|nr:hypothetical protein GQ600_7687 [Phytophthora cactorum]